MKETEVARLFNERSAHFIAAGYHGPSVFDMLAADAELPFTLTLDDMAAIERVQRETVRTRRKRGIGPPTYREGRIIRASRPDYCLWLKSKFVK
ncbi:hypothetical protein GOB43_18025 [Sinorhizobium meliloti]|uniref:hypothetical protein n=1 Tax=Rhizobium meliloti TaxID=382 RepID=UPI000FDC6DC4|nr:hypothetical protein [Sinorhizobium meliloti]MDW9409567.1 hypothetical protein [Sinorhizobium meliloti]MDW9440927.1 hypothetical protein [Sinorhizobium meliloti]MDW9454971.1 hypothetical protein [Sinorhizobium meliloti]MDW9467133.1 hypothetical protein [Sinorhizobium meliloti]MDW9519162.1 hypothetical protein [Sinorhizobium meliloti]